MSPTSRSLSPQRQTPVPIRSSEYVAQAKSWGDSSTWLGGQPIAPRNKSCWIIVVWSDRYHGHEGLCPSFATEWSMEQPHGVSGLGIDILDDEALHRTWCDRADEIIPITRNRMAGLDATLDAVDVTASGAAREHIMARRALFTEAAANGLPDAGSMRATALHSSQ